MDDDRLVEPLGEIEVPLEDGDLRLPRRVHVVVVEPRLPDRDDPLILRQPLDLREGFVIAVLCFVRMKADGGPDVVVLPGHRDRGRSVIELRGGDDEAADTVLARAGKRGVGVGHGEVAMGVGEKHENV